MVLMAEEKNKLNWESINTLSFNDQYKVPLTLEESLNEISFRKDPSTQNYLEFSDIYGETWKPVMSANAILNLLKTVDSNDSGLNADTLDGYQPSIPVYIPVLQTDPVLSTVVVRGTDNSISTNIIKFTTNIPVFNLDPGQLAWNNTYKTLDLKIDSGVTLQLGQEDVTLVKNNSTEDILNGDIVYATGSDETYIEVAKAKANSETTSKNTLGIATEDILINNTGFVTSRGLVGSLNTTGFTAGRKIYLSPTIAGKFTENKPNSPDIIVEIGYIVDIDNEAGKIYAMLHTIPGSDEISYNPVDSISGSGYTLLATNVKGALDELNKRKANVDELSTNILLYPTTTDSDTVGYFKIVTSKTDSAYLVDSTDIPTGVINGLDQLLSSFISEPGVFVGDPGNIVITVFGNIRKTDGNSNRLARFFFKVFKMDEDGIETYLGESFKTATVSNTTYAQFSAIDSLTVGEFGATDRLVVKFYADYVTNPGGEFSFQFGGPTPVTIVLEVPVYVVPSQDASGIIVNTSLTGSVPGILNSANNTVQSALETIHTHNHNDIYYTETEINSTLSNKSDVNHTHDDMYYTETELDDGQLDNRYYTETETIQNFEKLGTVNNYTILSSGWIGSTAPFTYQFTLSGITANTRIEWYLSPTATLDQAEAWSALNLQDGGNTNDTVNLKAYGEKSTIDIPVKYILGGELNNA